jgi:hypothetical protein
MPPLPDARELERYVEEAAKPLGLSIEPAWRPLVAEHLRRLLEAAELIERSQLGDAEPATRFEP